MRNLTFILVASVMGLLSSCSRDFYVNKYCPITKVTDTTIITVKDSVVIHDTIVVIKADTAVIHDTVPCSDFKKEFHSGRANIKIEVKDSVLTAECICQGLELKLQWYEYWHSKVLQHYREVERTAVVNKRAGFQTFKTYWFWITAVLIALFISLKVLAFYKKFSLPF